MMSIAGPDEDDKRQSLLKRLGAFMRGDTASTQIRESIEEAIEESARHTKDLSAPERQMLSNLLKFGELKVSDVMIPRADIVAVDEEMSLPDFRGPVPRCAAFAPAGLSRDAGRSHRPRPYQGCHQLRRRAGRRSFRWKAGSVFAVQALSSVRAASMPLLDLLTQLQAAQHHLAL